ncbi:MAG: SAM-dependent methyltransferase [Acidimicrobiia bacterium]|nr:SAM-dependent methyltransferase [Acidimicrobiia bacterium]
MKPVKVELRARIEKALADIPDRGFPEATSDLLKTLGYQSHRVLRGQTGNVSDFVETFPAENRDTRSEKRFLDLNPTVRILYQVADSEVGLTEQRQLAGFDVFDLGNTRSFVFVTIELPGETYPRGEYAEYTREVNKRMRHPTVVLFRTASGLFTIAFMERRPDLRDGNRDVLGKVSLIREMDSTRPHPAYVRILEELSLPNLIEWMKSHLKPVNFDGLLTAWLDCLDTEKLNKQFYKKLFDWFEHAIDEARFATLNTEINQRGFNDTGSDSDSSRYHYRHEIADPKRLRSLFDETPFINGGLFDCLDNPTTGDGGGLIDCFTDNPAHRDLLSVPNRLFFGPDGLIDLFDDYRFTVEENTPIEQDVALDPELLGRVFENLLAAFTPGTEVSARKRSGSYYTPRQVVDYMVTEALVAYWKDTVEPADGAPGWWEERLRYLLDYADEINDAHEFFEPSERQDLIRNLASIKVLDPAVGSGAFPMSILHRLTLALRRLDPNN